MKKEIDIRIPKHTSILGTILSVVGIILIIISAFIFLFSIQSPLAGIAGIPAAAGLFAAGMICMAIGEITAQSQHQTKILVELLKKELGKEDATRNS